MSSVYGKMCSIHEEMCWEMCSVIGKCALYMIQSWIKIDIIIAHREMMLQLCLDERNEYYILENVFYTCFNREWRLISWLLIEKWRCNCVWIWEMSSVYGKCVLYMIQSWIKIDIMIAHREMTLWLCLDMRNEFCIWKMCSIQDPIMNKDRYHE